MAMNWVYEGTPTLVNGQTFVGADNKQVRPTWSGPEPVPTMISVHPEYQKWFNALLQFAGVRPRFHEADVPWDQYTVPSRARKYVKEGIVGCRTANPLGVPAPTRTAKSFTFSNDVDGPTVRSPRIYSATIGMLKYEVEPTLAGNAGVPHLVDVGIAVRAFRVRGTIRFAIDPAVRVDLLTGAELAETILDEYRRIAFGTNPFDAEKDAFDQSTRFAVENSLAQLYGLLPNAFAPPGDWQLSPGVGVEADAGDIRTVDQFVVAPSRGIGVFALRCSVIDDADAGFQLSELFAIEVDDEGEPFIYADVSELDLRRCAEL